MHTERSIVIAKGILNSIPLMQNMMAMEFGTGGTLHDENFTRYIGFDVDELSDTFYKHHFSNISHSKYYTIERKGEIEIS